FKNTGVESESFWSEKYQQQTTPWDLDRPHPELDTTLAQLKLNKMRVLVPGCGSGHDAAFLAEKGNVVTAIDFSPTAIEQAQKKYGDRPNLTFLEGDVFNLDDSHTGAYDLVFEHTCYCAIDPSQRSMLIKQWKRFLDETGHLLGIFFAVPKRTGPYFGGSEWELREKLKKDFQFYYWTRLRHSPDWRRGAELLIYGRKN
ncbi:MAG: methyltransferase domain-containing protein, partial [Pseudomonadota bacterium]